MPTPTIEMRPYQVSLTDDARDALRHVRKVILHAPTGAGKTVMASYMIRNAVENGKRCYFNVHRQELLEQTSGTFQQFDIEHSFIAAGYDHDPDALVQIVSIDTLARRLGRYPAPDLAIVDEAHHAVARTWLKVLESWEEAYVVGLSATPERLDGRGLGKFFDAMVQGPDVFDLITQGYLSKYALFAPEVGVDTSQLSTVAGDFNKKELAELMDNYDLIAPIAEMYHEHAAGRKAIGFAVNVQHSRHIVEVFQAHGIRAVHLDAKTKRKTRRQVLRDYAHGKYDVVWNVGLFGEGFDLEANANFGRAPGEDYLRCTVECVISARPTASLSIWLQQVGRALRPKDEHAVILDHAGNVWRHGLPDEDREFSLKSKRRKKGEAPVKQCPACFAIVPAAAMQCPMCEYIWPQPEGRGIDEGDGELIELDIEGMRKRKLEEIKAFKKENRKARTYEDLVALAISRGSKHPNLFAQNQLDERERTRKRNAKRRRA